MRGEHEPIPKLKGDTFSGFLSELTHPREQVVGTATITLRDLNLGIIHDPRIIAGRMMLILQKNTSPQGTDISTQTVRVELFAGSFKTIAYYTGRKLEQEIQRQLHDVGAQRKPLSEDETSYTDNVLEELVFRLLEAKQKFDENEKIPSPQDLKDIRKGLKALTGRFRNSWSANRNLLRFFNRQFEQASLLK